MWMLVCFVTAVLLFPTEGADCNLSNRRMVKPITAYTGQSVLLPCSCDTPTTNSFPFTWQVFLNEHRQIFLSTHNSQYEGRIKSFNDSSPGNFSLLLSKLTMADEAGYRCNVKGDFTDIRLSVKGCILSGPNNQVTELHRTTGQSVVLPCSCTELQAQPPSLSWTVFKRRPEPKEKRVTYTDRVKLVGTDTSPGDLSLQISHLAKEDEGDYRCLITNDFFRDIRLHVKEADKTNKKDGSDRRQAETASKPPKTGQANGEGTTMEAQPTGGQTAHTLIYVSAAFIFLLIIGGVAVYKCRREKERKNPQEDISNRKAGGKNSTEENDLSSAMYATVNDNNMTAQLGTQEVDPSVTYSTIVHIEGKARQKQRGHKETSGDQSVYAIIKTAS